MLALRLSSRQVVVVDEEFHGTDMMASCLENDNAAQTRRDTRCRSVLLIGRRALHGAHYRVHGLQEGAKAMLSLDRILTKRKDTGPALPIDRCVTLLEFWEAFVLFDNLLPLSGAVWSPIGLTPPPSPQAPPAADL